MNALKKLTEVLSASTQKYNTNNISMEFVVAPQLINYRGSQPELQGVLLHYNCSLGL